VGQVGSTCYGSATDAVAAIASAEVGKVVPAGSTVYVVDAAAASASSVAYTLTPIDGSAPVTATVAVTVPPCMLIDWPDASVIAWGIGGVWILAAVIMSLRKAAKSDT
jgi:hypothetical protein